MNKKLLNGLLRISYLLTIASFAVAFIFYYTTKSYNDNLEDYLLPPILIGLAAFIITQTAIWAYKGFFTTGSEDQVQKPKPLEPSKSLIYGTIALGLVCISTASFFGYAIAQKRGSSIGYEKGWESAWNDGNKKGYEFGLESAFEEVNSRLEKDYRSKISDAYNRGLTAGVESQKHRFQIDQILAQSTFDNEKAQLEGQIEELTQSLEKRKRSIAQVKDEHYQKGFEAGAENGFAKGFLEGKKKGEVDQQDASYREGYEDGLNQRTVESRSIKTDLLVTKGTTMSEVKRILGNPISKRMHDTGKWAPRSKDMQPCWVYDGVIICFDGPEAFSNSSSVISWEGDLKALLDRKKN